jgi:predicted DNA-binding antitoxin AbrB/MazE fold protein
MISSTVEAVFENGVFRPLTSLEFFIPEGQHLKISVETENVKDDILDLATRVYAGLSEQQIDEIETIALDRTHFFNQGKCTE